MSYEPNIDEWIYLIKGNHIEHCKEQELLLDNNIIPVLERKDVFVDADRIARGLSLQKYFPYELLPGGRRSSQASFCRPPARRTTSSSM